jgi:ribosomal-protein-alanine N-acetyltransferase
MDSPQQEVLDLRPTLTTERLVLRPFQPSDAKAVQKLAGHELIAATTAGIPHPYPDGLAEVWISRHADSFTDGIDVHFAVALKATNELVGCVVIFGISLPNSKAELGYWIGVDYWGHGYCTEACHAALDYAFRVRGFNKISARHVDINPTSGKVMQKLGMRREGSMKKDVRKNGVFHDIEAYGILAEEFQSKTDGSPGVLDT